jgi:hypothetical protein
MSMVSPAVTNAALASFTRQRPEWNMLYVPCDGFILRTASPPGELSVNLSWCEQPAMMQASPAIADKRDRIDFISGYFVFFSGKSSF